MKRGIIVLAVLLVFLLPVSHAWVVKQYPPIFGMATGKLITGKAIASKTITGKQAFETFKDMDFSFTTNEGLIYALQLRIFSNRVHITSADGSYRLHFYEANEPTLVPAIALNEYFVLTQTSSATPFTHVLRYVGHDPANKQLKFTDLATGDREITYSLVSTPSAGTRGVGDLVAGGVTYKVSIDLNTGALVVDQNGDTVLAGTTTEIIDQAGNVYTQEYFTNMLKGCIDTDNGQDFFARGKTTGPPHPAIAPGNVGYILGEDANKCAARPDPTQTQEVQYDCCVDATTSKTLVERYCHDGKYVASTSTECTNGCKDGVCMMPTCVDTDGGKDSLTYGYVNDFGKTYQDKCVVPTTQDQSVYAVKDGQFFGSTDSCTGDTCYVAEAFCGTQQVVATSYFDVLACPNGCSEGRCLAAPAQFCTDSDNGKVYGVKGFLNTSAPSWEPNVPDWCGIPQTPGDSTVLLHRPSCSGAECYLIELFCDGAAPNRDIQKCANCTDGACSMVAPVPVIAAGPTVPVLRESVRCYFLSARAPQKCFSSYGECSGRGGCVANVVGPSSTRVTWASTCKGTATTLIDGRNEVVRFRCGGMR